MSIFYRPIVTQPVRCSPAFFARPAYPTLQDFGPLFAAFDDSFAQLEKAQRQARRQIKRPFNPKFDVKETSNAYSVQGELPGFDVKDLSIQFLDDGHTLQIKGTTVTETKQQQSLSGSSEQDAVKTVDAAPATEAQSTPETSSVRSHQPTVEDDVEQPANASAIAEQDTSVPAEQESVAESATHAAQPDVQETQPETKQWVTERQTGSFTRSFQFPSKIDQEAVKASLKDGILAITLPFVRKPESRQIQIE